MPLAPQTPGADGAERSRADDLAQRFGGRPHQVAVLDRITGELRGLRDGASCQLSGEK